MSIALTKEQEMAVKGIKKWFSKGYKQQCVLTGAAGTGKTFLVNHIIEELGLNKRNVAFATFTGKASLLLKKANPEYSLAPFIVWHINSTMNQLNLNFF